MKFRVNHFGLKFHFQFLPAFNLLPPLVTVSATQRDSFFYAYLFVGLITQLWGSSNQLMSRCRCCSQSKLGLLEATNRQRNSN